ncbi:MAG TPA: LysE family translocator [Flavobacteriaceae bacterium]|jgi:threonine/homoserine/homoserine lactone efflux protein|nr:LysE family translocator [Flavobacteriales bacterium]MDP7183538.1 LysE family translocator [Flavobacteriaceae bacterium]HJO70298.1 LysE family translocator [Flavobacteriaceae bacterium]|tara:strand:- start:5725 stop:6321 length:597 start_codon:yes stop_codon:yes gene_type:complete
MNTEILFFLISSISLTLMPGPDILFVISQSISKNKTTGMLISLGLCTGLLIHTMLLVFGFSSIISNNYFLFKLFSSFYMLLLMTQEINLLPKIYSNKSNYKPNSPYLKGLIMNLINPKVILFFIAFFPAFLFSKTLDLKIQFTILGLIFFVQALIIFISVSYLSKRIFNLFNITSKSLKISYIKSLIYLIIIALIWID